MGKSKLALTHADDGLELSREEFADADLKPPWRYERSNGRLVVMSPAGHEHHSRTAWFRNHLGSYALQNSEIVEHVFQESWATVDDDTDRIPDIAVYLVGNTGRIPDRVPDLVFEIVSESAADRCRDYEEKRDEYERLGVREYVIVDGFAHKLTILRRGDEGFVETQLGPGDEYTSPLLPGLLIPLEGVL